MKKGQLECELLQEKKNKDLFFKDKDSNYCVHIFAFYVK